MAEESGSKRGGKVVLRMRCPVCGCEDLSRDGSTAMLFVCSWLLPPFSWLLFLLNPNVFCDHCGVRFKK